MTQVEATMHGTRSTRVKLITRALRDLSDTALRTAEQIEVQLDRAAAMVQETVAGGGTLFFCGNGGSAADAQNMATEYIVRFARNRDAYPAIALTTDTSLITAAGTTLASIIFSSGRCRPSADLATC